jgi:uncharacterized membrane-anchored protein YhcB (DUF1043 family)
VPLGWTSEQKAGIRRWWQFGTIFTVIGVLLGVILIVKTSQGAKKSSDLRRQSRLVSHELGEDKMCVRRQRRRA